MTKPSVALKDDGPSRMIETVQNFLLQIVNYRFGGCSLNAGHVEILGDISYQDGETKC